MKRILCLDVGEKRIGVSVSDPLGLTAQGVETIYTKGETKDRERIIELLNTYGTDLLLSGMPKNLDGTKGFQAERIERFMKPFEDMGYRVFYQDERLTTMSAHKALLEADMSRAKRKTVVDKLASTFILQTFIDSGRLNELNKKRITLSEVYRNMDGFMEQDAVVTLIDEDGNEVEFEHIMTLEHKGGEYVLLSPITEMDDVEDDELIILKLSKDAEGNDVYVSIEDDKIVEEVYDKYLQIAENEE